MNKDSDFSLIYIQNLIFVLARFFFQLKRKTLKSLVFYPGGYKNP